jgi:NAD(P)-dependent dehydrogenase (short-subunit alcohol dehydrogenase family)
MHPAIAKDRVAVITGGASGIGRAAARRLADLGLRIVLVDVNAEKLADAETEIAAIAGGAGRVVAAETDVADLGAMQKLAWRVGDDWEPPSVLMNNAAKFVHGGAGGSVFDPPASWRAVFDVNLWGAVNGVAAFAEAMIGAGGPRVIVNTGSKQGITLPPGNACYDTTKAALNAYTQLLAHELRNREGCIVTAHLLVPGWTTTGDNEHKPGAWLPEQVIDYLLEALDRGDFFAICPDDETTTEMDHKRIVWHAFDMVRSRPALSRWHPDHAAEFAAWMEKDLPGL